MIEGRGVVRFLWAKNMEVKDIHKEMLPMYGEHCLSRQEVHNWVQNFSEGRTSIKDEHRAGRPVEIATPETLQGVEDIIRAERRVTVDAVATAIGCSRGQAYNMMHEGLGFHRVCSRWVPRQLTPQHKISFKWEVLQHPPYSPDLAPSEFHFFGPLKHHLSGKRFPGDDAVERAVRACFPTGTKRILRRRFPRTCETVGQVFKFVWRLC
jgi:transposase